MEFSYTSKLHSITLPGGHNLTVDTRIANLQQLPIYGRHAVAVQQIFTDRSVGGHLEFLCCGCNGARAAIVCAAQRHSLGRRFGIWPPHLNGSAGAGSFRTVAAGHRSYKCDKAESSFRFARRQNDESRE